MNRPARSAFDQALAIFPMAAFLILALGAAPSARAAEVDSVGPMQLAGLDGRPASLRFDGAKVTLVNFWATWCMPCRQEMPRLDKLYRDYKSKGLQVVGVAVESGDPELVRDFLEQNLSISYPAMVGTLEVMEKFGEAEIVPTTYLVDPAGKIVARHYGVTKDFEEQIESEIRAQLGGASSEKAAPPAPAPEKLSASDRKVIDALVEDWSKPGHFSPVDLVMRNLGVAPSHAARVRLGRHLMDDEDLHPSLARFGAVSVVLSKEEKMIVRALLGREAQGSPTPTVQELAVMTGARVGEVPLAIDVLRKLGFVEPAPDGLGVGMRVSSGLAKTIEPIDLAATVVKEPAEEPFCVASLPRYLTRLVASPPDGRVTIDGLCSHCASKVQVVMEKGRVILPTSAVLLLGGGGYDALFLSPAHLEEWMRDHPDMKDFPHVELTEFVDSLHSKPVVAGAGPGREPARAAR